MSVALLESWGGRVVRGVLPEIRVGVDWDDVVMPWYDRAVQVCRDAGLCPPDVQPTSWRQHEEMGISFEDWVGALDVATASGELYNTTPFPGAVEALRRLFWSLTNCSIHIVTARGTFHGNRHNGWIQARTLEQIEEFAVPHHSVTFTRDKTAVPTDFFIDDSLRNYHDLDKADVQVYLLNRPWNLQDDTIPPDRRVTSVDQFVDIVLEAARA